MINLIKWVYPNGHIKTTKGDLKVQNISVGKTIYIDGGCPVIVTNLDYETNTIHFKF